MEKASGGLTFLVLLLTVLRWGNCQCYQSLDCVGSVTVPGQSTLEDCCMGTDDGLSWRSGDGSCTNCISETKQNVANTQLIDKNSPHKGDGHLGGTQLRKIREADDMFIGFPERSSVVRENVDPLLDRFPINRMIHSLRTSELDYFVVVSVTNDSTATVSVAFEEMEETDASFGARNTAFNTPTAEYLLSPGEQVISGITLYIINDFSVEDNETFTLRVSPGTVEGVPRNFECYDDGEDPVEGNYFCSHTITIVDEDEPFVVSFEHSIYEVAETAGQVEVCVILTRPDTDIFENVVAVEVFEDEVMKTNEHFPNDAAIANGDTPDADYEKQELGNSTIRKERITEFDRRICYNQTIYDDTLLEETEYAGLTLRVQDLESMGGPTTAETVVNISHAAIRILDDEKPLLTFEQTSYTLAEDDSNMTYDLLILRHIQSPLTFSIQLVAVAGGTAGAGDYSLPTDVFLFGPEVDNITVPITITGDDRVELTEDFLIQMTPASSVSFSTEPSVISIFIEDDDGDFILRFEESTYVVDEGQNISVCFFVENPPSPNVGFEFQFNVTVVSSDGSARAGEDYVAINTTLLGSTVERQCVTVRTLDDMTVEGKETLILSAIVDDNVPVSFSNTAEVTINDRQEEHSTQDSTNLVFIVAIPIVVTALLTAVIVVAIIVGIVCYKRRNQQRRSAKQELEMPEIAAREKPSDTNGTSHTPHPPEHREARRVSPEYVDVGYSPPGPVDTIKMERNVVYGVGGESDPDAMIYEEVIEDDEYEAIDDVAPQSQSQAPDVMNFNMNVAYGVV